MKQAYTEHLTNQEYNTASELWYHAEDRLKQCVENGDGTGALAALCELKTAVKQRFSPILTPWEMTGTLFGIVGGILHFACRDAGLPPAYLTLMLLQQKDSLSAVFSPDRTPFVASFSQSPDEALDSCVLYSCEMVQSFSLPEYSPLVRRCVSYIQQHLTDTLSVDFLAEMAGITRQYLSSQFHKETGKTPTEYINHERIRLSKYYLRQENYSITQIALMCGYGDSNYFGRTFKNITGKTPSAYRSLVKSQLTLTQT